MVKYQYGISPKKEAHHFPKLQICFVLLFVVERELSTTVEDFREIVTIDKWPWSAYIGIFWTWRGAVLDNLDLYDFLTNQLPDQ
jgi:hypothetical protein